MEILNHPELQDKHPEEHHYNEMVKLLGTDNFDDVLDLSCGEGYFAYKIKNRCEKIKGIDINETKIKKAKETFDGVEYDIIDLEKNSIYGSYDLIIFSDAIYYLTQETQKRVMNEIHNALKQNGYLLTSRHLGNGDQELNSYTHLFRRLRTNDVYNLTTPSRWRVTLWKVIK